jgi:hypothetical protein
MNERLKELAEQAGLQGYFLGSGYIARNTELERFAELVRDDEREAWAVQKFHLESELDKTQDLLNDCLVEKHFRARGEK